MGIKNVREYLQQTAMCRSKYLTKALRKTFEKFVEPDDDEICGKTILVSMMRNQPHEYCQNKTPCSIHNDLKPGETTGVLGESPKQKILFTEDEIEEIMAPFHQHDRHVENRFLEIHKRWQQKLKSKRGDGHEKNRSCCKVS